MKFLKFFSFHLVIISLIFQPSLVYAADEVYAGGDIKIDSGNQNAPIIHDPSAQNGNNVVIDIKEQNGSGLSHNKFIDYNTINFDQIINNNANSGQSVLAGKIIDGNSNFNGNQNKEASKILFEVSGSSTMLKKDIEIFGKKADFILSNSKGIMCSGCGFINTSNVSLVTGNVTDVSDVDNIKYQISENKDSAIVIDGNGITFYGVGNDELFDLNLISRAVKIAAAIKADSVNNLINNTNDDSHNNKIDNLNIRTGAGEFSSNTKTFTNNYQNSDSNNNLNLGSSTNNTAQENSGFAVVIDSTALGGVRAGQISIIATEQGAGVKTDDKLISDLSSVTITADGDIKFKAIETADDNGTNGNQSISVTSTSGKIETINKAGYENRLNAKDQIRLTAHGNITLNELENNLILRSNANPNLQGQIKSTNGDVIITTLNNNFDITNSGLIQGNNVSLTAKSIINNKEIIAQNLTSLTAENEVTNNANGIIKSNLSDVTITANNLTNHNEISAANQITITTSNNITNNDLIKAGIISLSATNQITNGSNSTIEATSGNLTLSATNGKIVNSGNLISVLSLNLQAGLDIENSGLIKGSSSIILTAKNIINKTTATIEGSNISLTAAQDGKISNEVGATIQNNGANLVLNLNNSDLDNSGTIQATNSSLEIRNGKNINNTASGSINAQSDLTLKFSGLLTNKKTIQSTLGKLILEGTASSSFTHEANTIFASGAGKAIEITLGTLINEAELDLKGGFLTLSDQTNQGLFNNAKITSSNSDLTISGNATNNSSGVLQSNANYNIVLNSLNGQIINSGLIATDKELQITGDLTNKKTIARIDDTAPLDVTNVNDRKYLKILIKSGTLTNDTNGQIVTENYLVIDGNDKQGNLTSLGLIRSNHFSDVNNFDDNNAIEIKNINVLTNEGVIDASEDLIITANELFNQNSGLLFASNNAILNVDKLDNNNANIITSFGDILIQKQIINNSDGTKTFVKSSEVNNINNAQIKTLKTAIDAPLFDEADIRRVLEQYAIEMLSTNNFSATELTNRIYALRGFLKDSNLSIEEQVDQVISGNIKINTVTLTNDQKSIISSNNYIKIEADTINNNNNSVLASATYFDIITNNLNNQNNAQIYGATVLNIKAANESDVNNQINNSGLIRGSAVYLNTARLTNSNSQSSNNTIDSLFGQSFTSNNYQFTNNNLFIINGSNKFLIAINEGIADTTNNDEHLNNFLNAIGVDLNNPVNAGIKLLGDDIYLSQFIANIISDKTNNRYITFDATSDTKQLTSFLDTTKAQMQKLNIAFGSQLTDEQRANLTDPFIAFEKQDVFVKGGQIFNSQVAGGVKETIYIPKIITPFETTIDEETSQIARKNVAAIEARNELIINATQEVRNKGEIKAGTIIIETTNFTNELDNQILTIDENGNLKYIAKPAKIEAKNDIFISAKEDFNNIGAEIAAGNALFVDAKNINITAAKFAAVSNNYQSGNGWSKNVVTNNLYNISSNLSANDIILNSKNNVNIIASNLSASGLLQIAAGNDLNIKSATDTKTTTTTATNQYQETYKIKKRRYGTRTVTNTNIQTDIQNTEIASNLTGANVILSSGNDFNIDKSKITASNYLQIETGNDANLNNSEINSKIALINSGRNVNLIGNKITAQDLLQISAINDLNIKTFEQTTKAHSYASGRKWAQSIDSVTTTNSGFNSLSGENIVLSSGNDTNIIGASLTATNAIQIDTGNNLTIESAKDETKTTVQNWGRKGSYSQYQTNTVNKETNSNLTAQNIYLNSGNKLSVTNTKINTGDLIATSLGKITFRNNSSKTTGSLALINDQKIVNPTLALKSANSANSQSISLASSPNDPILPPTGNPSDDVINTSAADIIYEAGTGEHSTNDLIFMTSADIINHGYLLADGDISLSATNITNSKVQNTQNYWYGFNTTLSGEALIKAGGNVLLQATNDINNYAGTIIAETGNITLLAGNNVNIGTMQERQYVHVGGKFTYHYDKITNHGSNISAGNNIVIKAGNNSTTQNQNSGNINITGSNLTSGTNATATEGHIFLNAANDVNIKSSTDSLVTYGNSRKSSFYEKRQTNNESNLTAGKNSANGSIYINTFNIDENNQGAISTPPSLAAKDISNNVNITGSNLTAKDDVYLTANNDITIASAQDTFERIDRFKSKKRSSTTEINQTTQVTSDITAQNGSIQINALGINSANGGDVEIVASNLSAANSIEIIAAKDISIISAQNEFYQRNERSKKGSFGRNSRSSQAINEITQIASNLNANSINLNSGNNINIIASNLTSNLGNIDLTARKEINILSDVNFYEKILTSTKTGLTVKKETINIHQKTTNVASNLVSAGNININSGSNTNIVASNLSGQGSGNITVGAYLDTTTGTLIVDDEAKLNILAAVDSEYTQTYQNKTTRGLLMQVPVVRQVVKGLLVVAGSYWNGITGGNLDKTDGLIGEVKDRFGTTTTNETLASSTLTFGQNLNVFATDDITIEGSNLETINGNIALTSNNNINILAKAVRNFSGINASRKNVRNNEARETSTEAITNIASQIKSGNNLNISSTNDIAIQASKLNANNALTIDARNNLLLLTATNSRTFTDVKVKKGTWWESTDKAGSISTNIAENEITSNNGNTVITIDAQNNILLQHKEDFQPSYIAVLNPGKTILDLQKEVNVAYAVNTGGMTDAAMAGIAVVIVVATVLTAGAAAPAAAGAGAAGGAAAGGAAAGGAAAGAAAAGSAGIAVTAGTAAGAAVASGATAVGISAGVAGTLGTIASAAVTSAVIAGISTTLTSLTINTINSEGNIGRGIKQTTSKESLQNIAMATLAAGLTAGIAEGVSYLLSPTVSGTSSVAGTASNSSNVVSNGSNVANSGSTLANNGSTLASAGSTTANASTSISNITNQFKAALLKNGINSISSSATQSLLKGESFSDSLKRQGINVLISSLGQIGANQIGNLATTPRTDINGNYITDSSGNAINQINETQQFALHGLLGCGMAAAGGNDCASGALSGMAGEFIAAKYRDHKINELIANKQGVTAFDIEQIKKVGGAAAEISGIFSTIATGGALGYDSSKIADNIYSGSMIAKNSAENNALDTIYDALVVAYDLGKIGYGYYVDDKGLIKEGFVDLAADGTALLVPMVPAGSTKVKRIVEGIEQGGKFSEISFKKADDLNRAGKEQYSGYQDEWQQGSSVIEFKTGENTEFYRVTNNPEDPRGNWLLNKKDIEGLTPAQIQQKYALPETPSELFKVNLPKDISMYSGKAAGNNFGSGGGTQYFINVPKDDLPRQWFIDPQKLIK